MKPMGLGRRPSSDTESTHILIVESQLLELREINVRLNYPVYGVLLQQSKMTEFLFVFLFLLFFLFLEAFQLLTKRGLVYNELVPTIIAS